MSVQSIKKPASDRQLAYIERLKLEIGEDSPTISDEISSPEASTIIGELVAKLQKVRGKNGQRKINEARLGMAMKECFRLWTGLGRDIFREKRKGFIEEVVDTYFLFTEIVEQLQHGHNMTR